MKFIPNKMKFAPKIYFYNILIWDKIKNIRYEINNIQYEVFIFFSYLKMNLTPKKLTPQQMLQESFKKNLKKG